MNLRRKSTDLSGSGRNSSMLRCIRNNIGGGATTNNKNNDLSSNKKRGMPSLSCLRNLAVSKEKKTVRMDEESGGIGREQKDVMRAFVSNSNVYKRSHVEPSGKDITRNLVSSFCRSVNPGQLQDGFKSKAKVVNLSGAQNTFRDTSANNRIQSILTSGGGTRLSEYFVSIVENTARMVGMAAFSLFSGTVLLLETMDNCLYENTISFLRSIKPKVILLRRSPGILPEKLENEFPDTKIEVMGRIV